MTKTIATLAFGSLLGALAQYGADAKFVRETYHARSWNLQKNVVQSAALTAQAIAYLKAGNPICKP